MAKRNFKSVYDRSLSDPEGFWAEAAEDVHWIKHWDKVLDDSNKPFYRWFTGGMVTLVTTRSICTSRAGAETRRR